MAEPADAPGTAPVSDRRPVPRGVLPRGVQTWLMVALALGILVIIVLTGQPESPTGPRTQTTPASAPAADRVRDYQERLRLLDAQAAQNAGVPAPADPALPPSMNDDTVAPAPVDPLVEERRRREFESLFASNVVLSRRAGVERPDAGIQRTEGPDSTVARQGGANPSLDEVADAVMRATARATGVSSATPAQVSSLPATAPESAQPKPRSHTPAISAVGPLHRVLEGTVLDGVLANRLDGSAAAPVNVLVTNPLYSHSGQHVLIPAGARVLGETRPVQSLGETRLAVAFHRLLMPDGSTVALEQFRGLNQIGDSGLRDRVNQHYLSTFGATAAVGLVSGLSQLLGTAGMGLGDGDRTVIVAANVTDATSQASAQVLNRYLNRLPTITIREGHRLKVYITSDLDLPAWTSPGLSAGALRR